MININSFKESIYKDEYFKEHNRTLKVKNEEEGAAKLLSFVDMTSKGSFINISNKILEESVEIYKKPDRSKGYISFRRACDGICLLDLNKRKILLIIEIKSGFNEVKNKAFEQLIASYVKTRCILQTIEGYNPADYEEIGLIISYPPTGKATLSSTSLIKTKAAVIIPSDLDKLNTINAAKLSVDKQIVLSLSDYKIDKFHVDLACYNKSLLVKHISVTNAASSDIIDLDKLI